MNLMNPVILVNLVNLVILVILVNLVNLAILVNLVTTTLVLQIWHEKRQWETVNQSGPWTSRRAKSAAAPTARCRLPTSSGPSTFFKMIQRGKATSSGTTQQMNNRTRPAQMWASTGILLLEELIAQQQSRLASPWWRCSEEKERVTSAQRAFPDGILPSGRYKYHWSLKYGFVAQNGSVQ